MEKLSIIVDGHEHEAEGGYPYAVAALRGEWVEKSGEGRIGTLLLVVWPGGMITTEPMRHCRARQDGGAIEGF